MIDGKGAPESQEFQDALAALYSMAYTVKFMLKSAGRTDFVVPPLEALWWAEDVGAFHANKRDEWQWTMMIMQPEQVMQSDLAPALDQIGKKEQEVAIPRPATPCHSGGGARRPSDARRTLQ